MKKIRLLTVLLCFLTILVNTAGAAEVVIIVNQKSPVDALNGNDVKNIFLGKTSHWPDNSKIHFALLRGEIHKNFLKQFVGRTESQYNNYWKKMLFTGKGSKPKSYADEEEMLKYVRETAGAIGYVSAGTPTKEIKIVDVR